VRLPPSKDAALKTAQVLGGLPFVMAALAIVLVTGSALTWVTSPNWGKVTTSAPARDVGTVPTGTPAPTQLISYIAPNRIQIPAIQASAPIVKVGTGPQRELEIPLDPKIVGWWDGGAYPGASIGTAVFAGHINYAGVQGELARIGTLNPGDHIYITGLRFGKTIRLTFKVTGVRTYRKTKLPFAQIFDQSVLGRVAIVTCGGPFDAQTGNYLDNIVVYAVPA
jgi:hypothetical protein